jgi:hypothetical protein
MATSIEQVAMNVRYRVELSEVERGAASFAPCSAAASAPPAS